MNENHVTRPHGGGPQHVGRRRTGQQQVRRGRERQRGRLGEDVPGRHGDLRGVAAADPEREHVVTHPSATRGDLRPGPDGGQCPGNLETKRQRQLAAIRGRTRGKTLVIRGVHAGRAHGDRDLSGTRLRDGDLDQPQHVEAAEVCRNPLPPHHSSFDKPIVRRPGNAPTRPGRWPPADARSVAHPRRRTVGR